MLISAGATKGEKLFDGLKMTFRYFVDCLDAELWGEALVRRVDEKGAVLGQPEALEQSGQLGQRLVEEIKRDLEKGGSDV